MFGEKKEKKEQSTSQVEENSEEKVQPEDAKKSKGGQVTISEQEYKKLQDEANQYKEKYVRIMAEFDNARKRMDRDKVEFIKYANEGLMSEFLGILDDLERSIAAAKTNHQDYSVFLKGVEMVMGHIYDMLKKNNVKPMESLGKKFDPHCHEALMQEQTADKEDGLITEEYQRGYYFDDRVLRTAKVKVAKNPGEDVQEEHAETEPQDQKESIEDV